MKTLKLSIVALATLVLGTVFFISCSNEESTTNTDSNLTNFRITNANTFINDFYRTSWTTGATATVEDGLRAYHITEIIVDTDTRARGYLVKDKDTNELLYFADVDRTNYRINIINLVDETVYVEDNINLLPNYGLTDGFDFIQIIDDGNYDYQTNGFYTYGACAPSRVGEGCFAGVFYTKTFLGFKGKEKQLIKEGSTVQETTPCDCETGEVTPYEPN